MKHVVLAVLGLVLACAALDASEVGDRFPAFELKDLKGRTVSWNQFLGKVVIVNLWMTTCPPCVKEMPMLQQLQKKYANRGVVVVGISADEKAGTAEKFAKKLGVKYALLIDPNLMTSESEQKKFGFVGLPTTFIVDCTGVIRKKIVGFTSSEDIEKSLPGLLQHCP